MCVFRLRSSCLNSKFYYQLSHGPQTPGPYYHRSSVFIFVLTLFHIFWVYIRKVTLVNDKGHSMKLVHYTIIHSYHLAKTINLFTVREYLDSIIWKKYQRLNNASTTTSSVTSLVTITQHLTETTNQRRNLSQVVRKQSLATCFCLSLKQDGARWSWELFILWWTGSIDSPQAAKDKAQFWSPISFSRYFPQLLSIELCVGGHITQHNKWEEGLRVP